MTLKLFTFQDCMSNFFDKFDPEYSTFYCVLVKKSLPGVTNVSTVINSGTTGIPEKKTDTMVVIVTR